ncbi:hypothetical protein ACWDKQ_33815 [Saccharopolyspora sp. NPDC000995]
MDDHEFAAGDPAREGVDADPDRFADLHHSCAVRAKLMNRTCRATAQDCSEQRSEADCGNPEW